VQEKKKSWSADLIFEYVGEEEAKFYLLFEYVLMLQRTEREVETHLYNSLCR
jgi:hypothetical protein